jgi:putative transcriptional regulator
MRIWLIGMRKDICLSQKEVAKEAGLSAAYYCYIESGERGKKLPVKTAKAIASVLNFDWCRFYEEDQVG